MAEDLLEAALVEFAAHGFEGASTRAIAERAGAHQPQINYHFASKELLWKAAVDHLFGLLAVAIDADPEETDGVGRDPAAIFADSIRRFVRFSASRPELHRVMNLESTADSPRLAWIVERHVRPRFELVELAWAAVRAVGAGADLTTLEVWEVLIGLGALPFANAPLLSRLTSFHPDDTAAIDAHAQRVIATLFPETLTRRR